MSRQPEPTDTQKNILLAMTEGWRLRYMDDLGWQLFQPNRDRPFCSVKSRTVRKMTEAGLLSEGTTTQGLGYMPGKALTARGIEIGSELLHEQWAENYSWESHGGDTNMGIDFRHAA